MSRDTGGNPRIDFAWGNFPMQPNDDRGYPTGSSNPLTNLNSSGDAGRTVVGIAVGTQTPFVVGQKVHLTGLKDAFDSYQNVVALSTLNKLKFTIVKANYAPNLYGGGGNLCDITLDESFDALLGIPVGYLGVNSPAIASARIVADGPVNKGGDAGDKYWSSTNIDPSDALNAANNPFQKTLEGWNGYPAYLPGDFDNVPGGVLIPNTNGLPFDGMVSTEGPYAIDVLQNAGFSVTRKNVNSGYSPYGATGTRYWSLSQNGTKASIQLYSGELSTLPAMATGTKFRIDLDYANLPSPWSNTIQANTASFAASTEWVLVQDFNGQASSWIYAKSVDDAPADIWANNWGGWTDYYDSIGKNIGIGTVSSIPNQGLVKKTVPAQGLTTTAGKNITVETFGPAGNGVLSTFGIDAYGNFYFTPQNSADYDWLTPMPTNTPVVKLSGLLVMQKYGYVNGAGRYFSYDASQYNGTWTVTSYQFGRFYIDAPAAPAAQADASGNTGGSTEGRPAWELV